MLKQRDEDLMSNAKAPQDGSPARRRRRLSTVLATASMASWVVLGAMPIAAAIIALT